MRSRYRLPILIVSAVAVIASFGATIASATVLCKTASTPCAAGNTYAKGTVIEASTKAGTYSVLQSMTTMTSKAECGVTFKGEVTNPGGAGTFVSGPVTALSFGCKSGTPVKVLKTGTFSISGSAAGDGTLKLEGFETTVTFPEFNCTYSGAAILNLKGGAMASADVIELPIHTRSVGCGTSTKGIWSADFTLTSPVPLYVEEASVPPTVLCKTATDPCEGSDIYAKGTVLEASTKSGTHSFLWGPVGIKIECTATIKGEVTNPGGAEAKASGPITTLSFSSCTNGYQVTVRHTGSFSISSPSGGDGTLMLEGFETTVHTPLGGGINCIYSGSVPLSLTGGAMAVAAASETLISRTTGHSAFCGANGLWWAEFTVTAPEPLYAAGV